MITFYALFTDRTTGEILPVYQFREYAFSNALMHAQLMCHRTNSRLIGILEANNLQTFIEHASKN